MAARSGSRFQIHLSTAVILLLEIATFLYLAGPFRSHKVWSPNPRMRDDTVWRQEWGWPVRSLVIDIPTGPPRPGEYVGGYGPPNRAAGLLGIVTDLVVLILILNYTIAYLEARTPWLRKHLLSIVILVLLCALPWYNRYESESWIGEMALVSVFIGFELCLLYDISGPDLF